MGFSHTLKLKGMITIRTRNIKLNVFLNEEEKKLLKEKSNKARLSQSDFIRLLINQYSNIKLNSKEIDNIKFLLTNIINDLSKLKNQMIFLNYYDYSNFITKQIDIIMNIINKI